MEKLKLTCKACGAPLKRPRTGRPPRYCSTICRRSMEYEIRRAQQLLAKAEKAEQQARFDAWKWNQPAQVQEAAWWAVEVDRLNERLLELLEFDDGETDRDRVDDA